MKRNCTAGLLLAWCALSTPAAWAAGTGGVGADVATIHHIGPMTGPLAASNEEVLQGARLFFDEINRKGGVANRRIALLAADDKGDPKETTRILSDLAARREILTLFAPRTTPSIEAALPIVQENGLPMVAPQTGGSVITTPVKRYAFAIRATYQNEVQRAIELQHSVGIRRFAFLLTRDAFGKDAKVGADQTMAALKLQPVATQEVDRQKPELPKAIAAILATRPDIILIAAPTKIASDFVNGYIGAGGTAQFVSLSNTASKEYVTNLGANARGAIVMQVIPSPYNPTTRIAREFVAAAQANKLAVSYAAFQGYISAAVLVEGMRRAGRNLTPETLTRALESFKLYDLGDYVLQFDQNTRLGSKFVEASIISTNGRFIR
jgi:branched-chain amino acid transport system substrate-binding protein